MTSRREKGTGTVVKRGNHYHLKIRIGGSVKSCILRDKNGLPITNQKEAQKAAVKLRSILLAEQKEELILHLELARKMKNKVEIYNNIDNYSCFGSWRRDYCVYKITE